MNRAQQKQATRQLHQHKVKRLNTAIHIAKEIGDKDSTRKFLGMFQQEVQQYTHTMQTI